MKENRKEKKERKASAIITAGYSLVELSFGYLGFSNIRFPLLGVGELVLVLIQCNWLDQWCYCID